MSDRNLAILVRQMALHCNLSSHIQQSLGSSKDPYASSWLERLRAIKRIRGKVLKEMDQAAASGGSNTSGAHEAKSQPAGNDFTVTVLRRKDPGDN